MNEYSYNKFKQKELIKKKSSKTIDSIQVIIKSFISFDREFITHYVTLRNSH